MLSILASTSTSIIATLSAVAGVAVLLILAKVAERLKFSGDFEFKVRNLNLLSKDEVRLELSLDATSFKKKRVFNELALIYKDGDKEEIFYCLDYPLLPSSSNNVVVKSNKGHYGLFINPGEKLTCMVSFKIDRPVSSSSVIYLSYIANKKRHIGIISLSEDNVYYVRFKIDKKKPSDE